MVDIKKDMTKIQHDQRETDEFSYATILWIKSEANSINCKDAINIKEKQEELFQTVEPEGLCCNKHLTCSIHFYLIGI